VASDGSESTLGLAGSYGAALSGDGRYVAFSSDAPDLVSGDTNEYDDVFMRDNTTGAVERISVSGGDESNGPSYDVAISDDGRYLAFASGATNLVASDENGWDDIFVCDRDAGAIERVSVSSDGSESDGPSYSAAISADGRYVAFYSSATNLVPNDTNGQDDIFVRDRVAAITERVSVSSAGAQSDGFSFSPAVSDSGRFVAFASAATNLVIGDANEMVDVFVRDREIGITERVSVAGDGSESNGDSYYVSISANGYYVAFDSGASNLAAGDTNVANDVFRHDRYTGSTERISIAGDGSEAGDNSWGPAISGDGRLVSFESDASDLVPGDENEFADVFVHTGDWPVFPDVPADHWAKAEIEACYAAGIVGGYGDGAYHPSDVVTRDQMAVYIARALAGGEDNVPAGPAEATFDDVPTDNWAYDHIEYCYDQNVVQGYTTTTYAPTAQVTRDQMAVYVARALVAPTGEAALADYVPADPRNFPDVAPDFWAYKHIEFCVENEVVQGYVDGSYHPADVVTRDQMAVYIARAFQLPV